MIQPLNLPDLSSAKPRTGLKPMSELLPKLIRLYEMQAQARNQLQSDSGRQTSGVHGATTQMTFGWE